MKLRYLYLAIGVSCNASLVSRGDSSGEKTEIVACGISANALTLGISSVEVQIVDIMSEAVWEVAVGQTDGNWLTVSPLEGIGNGMLVISADKNNGPKRSATLTIAVKGTELRTITVIQDGYKGTIYNYGDFTGLQKAGLVAGINPITIVDNDECEDGKVLRIHTWVGEEYEGTNGDRFKVQTTT